MFIIFAAVMLGLLLFSGIFSASETAYTSVGSARIEGMVANKERGAKIIQKQHVRFNRTLGTILICNNIVNIASSTLFSYILTLANVDPGLATIISIFVMTPVIVLFTEILPKLVAKAKPIRTIKTFWWLIEACYFIFFPIAWPISKIGKKIYITNTEEEVKSLLNIANNEGVLETNESSMAKNVLDLDSTKVSQHYVKLKNIDYLNYRATLTETLDMFKETNFSRLPIEKDGNLIGIILLKDVFYLKKGTIMNYLKPVPMISQNSNLSAALEKMRQARVQMAFVTENNNTDKVIGLITIEDILEEVVGEIYDEFDTDESIYEISLEKAEARGTVKLKQLWKQLELDEYTMILLSEEDENKKLSEWLSEKVGHSLRKNTKYVLDDKISFKVIEKKGSDAPHDLIEIDWGK
ncbi:hemolysin family protein [Metamycoplasma subdolum]